MVVKLLVLVVMLVALCTAASAASGSRQAVLRSWLIMPAQMALPNGAGCTPPNFFQVSVLALICWVTSLARSIVEML